MKLVKKIFKQKQRHPCLSRPFSLLQQNQLLFQATYHQKKEEKQESISLPENQLKFQSRTCKKNKKLQHNVNSKKQSNKQELTDKGGQKSRSKGKLKLEAQTSLDYETSWNRIFPIAAFGVWQNIMQSILLDIQILTDTPLSVTPKLQLQLSGHSTWYQSRLIESLSRQ